MGMTYEELGIYGRLRKISRCGPVSMFRRLLVEWQDRCTLTLATLPELKSLKACIPLKQVLRCCVVKSLHLLSHTKCGDMHQLP